MPSRQRQRHSGSESEPITFREALLATYQAMGDINGDKEVNIGDVTALTNIILGGIHDATSYERADVNNDSEITIADIGQLLELIAKE